MGHDKHVWLLACKIFGHLQTTMKIDQLSLERVHLPLWAQLQVNYLNHSYCFPFWIGSLHYVHMKATNKICGKARTKLGNILLSGAILLFPP
jgi:hypothetical protein